MSSASDMIRGQFHKTIYDVFSSQKDRAMFLNQNLRFIKIKKFHGGESRDILHLYSYRTGKIFVIISLILNEFSYGKAQIHHRV